MGKGEIARYEQFLLFPQCLQNACYPGASKGVVVWEWAKNSHTALSFVIVFLSAISLPFYDGTVTDYQLHNNSPNDKIIGL